MLWVYLFCAIVSFILSIILTPVTILLSRKFNVYDWPSRRKVHTRPVPRWGGFGIFVSVVISIICAYLIFPEFTKFLSEKLVHESKFIGKLSLSTQLVGILLGSLLVLVLGMIDDKKQVAAVTKLLVQIIAAYCAMDFGVRISGLTLPFTSKYVNFLSAQSPPSLLFVSQVLTVFWLIGFMNTINLADGLDGLAAGIVIIASITFFIIAVLLQPVIAKVAEASKPEKILLVKQLQLSALLSITLSGGTCGFLLFNFHPAKIFLGDCGALFLGFLLASISIVGTLKTPLVISLFIPILIVALPVLDVLLAILRRLRVGMDVMRPDKEHIHHRLLKWGWSHREVVLVMYVITLILSIVTISITAYRLGMKI
ncbi:MAG: MraY family glycosyltransferase [Elusimicrobiota bacterium]|nr:MraY family glycosyltransferase [Elusimicrobiota bacterium]